MLEYSAPEIGEGDSAEEAVIFEYSRRQAIEDGVLVDVSAMATEAGFLVPVAITATVYAEIVSPDEAARAIGQSPNGRLWDLLFLLLVRAKTLGPTDDLSQTTYTMRVAEAGKSRDVTLKAVIGPGDEREPVITVMFPWED